MIRSQMKVLFNFFIFFNFFNFFIFKTIKTYMQIQILYAKF
jgi:hypothetical protein